MISYRMYCSLLRIQFTSSTQIKPSLIAYGFWMHYKYSLLTYLLTGAVSSLMMLWWLMKGCMGQRFATSVMLLFGLQNLCM